MRPARQEPEPGGSGFATNIQRGPTTSSKIRTPAVLSTKEARAKVPWLPSLRVPVPGLSQATYAAWAHRLKVLVTWVHVYSWDVPQGL